MKTDDSPSLFTNLSSEEASKMNGGYYGYYYPVYRCYPIYSSGGYSGGYGSSSNVNQTVNVNVQIED